MPSNDDSGADQSTSPYGDLSPSDRDYLIRTVIGEAGNDPGSAPGVAHVVLNRLASGQYGNSIPSVVLAPNQFESWDRQNLMGYAPTSPQYQQAAKVVDGVLSGAPDPTNGATKFYAPAAQAALGRQPPSWDDGSGVMLGKQKFFGGSAVSDDILGQFNIAPASSSGSQSSTTAPAPASDDILGQFNIAPSPNEVGSQTGSNLGELHMTPAEFDAMLARSKNPPPSNQDKPLQTFDPTAPISKQLAYEARTTGSYLGNQLAGVPSQIAKNFQSGNALTASGILDLEHGNVLPSFPSSNPQTWQAGGALKTVLGPLSALTSPLTGVIDKLVQEPVTQITGNPEAGARAGFVANSIAAPYAASRAADLMPAGQASNMVKSAIGSVPNLDVVNRLAANPNLRLIDVDPTAQAYALGLASDPSQPAFGILKSSANETNALAPQIVSNAYDSAMGATPNVKDLLDNLEAMRQANAKQGYNAAFSGAKPVDISPVLQRLGAVENPGVQSVISTPSNIPPTVAQQTATNIKSLLSDENGSQITDPQHLHEIQSQLRIAAEREAQRGGMESSIRATQLANARNGIVAALDKATGGKYSDARLKYREDSSIPEAFEKGTNIYKNGANTIENRPEYWQAWKEKAIPQEIEAAKIGARVAADQAIRGTRFAARNGENIPEVPFNLEKLKIILGPQEAHQLASQLADAKAVANTNSLLFGGSKTGLTEAAKKATSVRSKNALSLFSPGTLPALVAEHLGAGNLGTLGAAAAGIGANYLGRLADINRNTAAARLFTMPGGEALNQIYRAPSSTNALLGPAAGFVGNIPSQLNKPVNALAAPNQP